MVQEQIFKTELIKRLSPENGWFDGDTENTPLKKVDILNHNLKIAIEVKDDTVHKTINPTPENPIVVQHTSMVRMNTILTDHMSDARLKFKNYPEYKTILLFRTDHQTISSVRYAIDGLHTFTESEYAGRRSKYSSHIRENIGCFVICDYDGEFHYIPNPHCKSLSNLVSKTEAEEIFVQKLYDVDQV